MQTRTPKSLTKEQGDVLVMALAVHKDNPNAQAWSKRNTLAVLLMLDAGLRIGEVLQLKITDLVIEDQPAEGLRVRAETTKTKCERDVPLTERIKLAIKECQINVWPKTTICPGRLAFTKLRSYKAISAQHLERIIKEAGEKSLHRDIWPHVLRHTFATRLMRTTNARVVQGLLGHKRMSSTQVYCHPDAQDYEDAIKSLG